MGEKGGHSAMAQTGAAVLAIVSGLLLGGGATLLPLVIKLDDY